MSPSAPSVADAFGPGLGSALQGEGGAGTGPGVVCVRRCEGRSIEPAGGDHGRLPVRWASTRGGAWRPVLAVPDLPPRIPPLVNQTRGTGYPV